LRPKSPPAKPLATSFQAAPRLPRAVYLRAHAPRNLRCYFARSAASPRGRGGRVSGRDAPASAGSRSFPPHLPCGRPHSRAPGGAREGGGCATASRSPPCASAPCEAEGEEAEPGARQRGRHGGGRCSGSGTVAGDWPQSAASRERECAASKAADTTADSRRRPLRVRQRSPRAQP